MEGRNNTWREIRDLGRGGFGCVSLCQKGSSEEFIAIKRCHNRHMASDVSSKMMERWRTEVYIMGKLQHDNVIRAVELPPELKPRLGEPPILAMEYCEGGDLRKVLNLPQNCCGLREPDIRQLVSGISSAIEYLHSHRIIHRDLKPENIVLKNNGDMILYKIIDLGYVKELDNSSICNSFVGTQQYLAPELNTRQPYTKTVDYWSFGTLVFECISGKRPFVPEATPVQWHDTVKKKSPEDISAQFDEKGTDVFSKSLPKPNHLCRPLENYFEDWLRLMLRWDPKARGGGVMQIQGRDRPKCFFLMEQILHLKIFNILYVEANNVLSLVVREEHTIHDVQMAIESMTGVKALDQVIIQAKGQFLEPSQPALSGCSDLLSGEVLVFLFSLTPVKQEMKKNRKPPPPVQTILREKDIYLVPKEQRKVWARAVLWFYDQNRDYKRLVLSQRAALLCLLRCNSQISKQKTEMVKEMEKLFACAEHFQNGLNVDIQQHSQRLKCMNADEYSKGIQMQEQWLETNRQVEAMVSEHEQVKELDNRVDKLTTELMEVQKSPFGKTKQANPLDIFEEKARKLYDSLIAVLKDGGSKEQDEMTTLVINCFREQEILFNTLYKHIGKVIACLTDLQPVLPELIQVTEKITSHRKQLHVFQQQRQEQIWEIINTSMGGLTLNASQSLMPTALNETVFLQAGGGPSLLTSIANSNPESLRLVDDCRANNQRIQDMVESLFQDHEESMSYLTNMDVKRET